MGLNGPTLSFEGKALLQIQLKHSCPYPTLGLILAGGQKAAAEENSGLND